MDNEKSHLCDGGKNTVTSTVANESCHEMTFD